MCAHKPLYIWWRAGMVAVHFRLLLLSFGRCSLQADALRPGMAPDGGLNRHIRVIPGPQVRTQDVQSPACGAGSRLTSFLRRIPRSCRPH